MSTREELEREIRNTKRWAAAATVGVLVLGVAAFAPQDEHRFEEITAERINVVEPDGHRTVVLANSERIPGVVCGGETYGQTREGAGGMIFYDGKGNEVGGMIFSLTEEEDGGWSASRHFSFDRHNGDQTMVLGHYEGPESTFKGLRLVDRYGDFAPCEGPKMYQQRRTGDSAAKADAERWIEEHGEYGEDWTNRALLGVHDRTAELLLVGTDGQARIRMIVDSTNAARLEFLDAEGDVVERLP